MKYRIEIIRPLRPNVNQFRETACQAFEVARSHIPQHVKVYEAGRLIAQKWPGRDRLEHLKGRDE